MAGREVHIPVGGPPRVERPSPEIYGAMGEDAIFRMIADFYERLGASEIRWMFPDDMAEASKKSAAFFVGLLGGPPLYQQRFGSPMLRARHMPFPIDEDARQVWLATFRETLADAPEKYGFPAEHLPGFDAFLDAFSGWMVNTAPPGSDTPGQHGH